jgi:PTS system N-acetylgalactosamine-specific IIA component
MEQARAIIIGHEAFAEGMRSAVDRITGRGEALIALTSQNLSLPQIVEALSSALTAHGLKVIFTDLQAGSATMAARKVLHDLPGAVLIAGTNLPMLLDFVLNTATNPVEAAKQAAEKGRDAIAIHGGQA